MHGNPHTCEATGRVYLIDTALRSCTASAHLWSWELTQSADTGGRLRQRHLRSCQEPASGGRWPAAERKPPCAHICLHMPAHASMHLPCLHGKHTDGCSRCNLSIHPEGQCCVQVSDAAASQQQHMEQANNATYLLESFHKLVHDLEEPLGVSNTLSNLLSSPPCAA